MLSFGSLYVSVFVCLPRPFDWTLRPEDLRGNGGISEHAVCPDLVLHELMNHFHCFQSIQSCCVAKTGGGDDRCLLLEVLEESFGSLKSR